MIAEIEKISEVANYTTLYFVVKVSRILLMHSLGLDNLYGD